MHYLLNIMRPVALRFTAAWQQDRAKLGVVSPAWSANLTSYRNERKVPETGVVPISSGYTLGFRRGREERCQAQFL
jgi:hypothetical protein